MDLHEKKALEASGQPFRRHPWEQARASLVRQRFAALAGPGSFVLDVGCGDCYILEELARAAPGGVYIGVDSAYPEPTTLESGVQVYPSLEQIPAEHGHPSLILLMDVIEHVPDDIGFVEDLRRRDLLGPKTQVFVTVPAFQLLFSEHDRWLGHYRRYNVQRLRRALRGAGLTVGESGYWFALPLLVRILEVVLERTGLRRFQATGLVGWKGGKTVSALLHRYLCQEALALQALSGWMRRAWPGLTCYAACRERP